jgi:ATP-dependent Clp protease ATP-binding subunit ClpA
MRQFLTNNNQAFRDLEQRANATCVVFSNQEMPPGTIPARLRIGFEINGQDGSAVLLVDEGAVYSGENQEIREWFRQGEKRFANFTELCQWLNLVIKPAFYQTNLPSQVGSIDNLTDFTRVNAAVNRSERVSNIDSAQLFAKLSAQIRGQDAAILRLSKKIAQHLARHSPRRPATVFALGPTGVGKTQTAQCLPTALRELDAHHSDFHFLRLDMSEYQENHRVSQLLGAPQGYIGYGDGAQLVDTVSLHPQSIILFDEIEKAHPNILKTLMNAMDAGRLSSAATTSNGREIDCRHAVFFFTSNLEVTEILAEIETRQAFDKPFVIDEICRKHLKKAGIKPELIGRIGCFLVYQTLNEKARTEILALSIVRVASEYGLNIGYIEPETLKAILRHNADANFGARPDEYLIDELLGTMFAESAVNFGETPLTISGTTNFGCEPMLGEN